MLVTIPGCGSPCPAQCWLGGTPELWPVAYPGPHKAPAPHAGHRPGYGSRVGRERRDSGTVREWMWGRQAGDQPSRWQELGPPASTSAGKSWEHLPQVWKCSGQQGAETGSSASGHLVRDAGGQATHRRSFAQQGGRAKDTFLGIKQANNSGVNPYPQ